MEKEKEKHAHTIFEAYVCITTSTQNLCDIFYARPNRAHIKMYFSLYII